MFSRYWHFCSFLIVWSKLPALSEATALESYGEAYIDVLINQYGGDINTALIDSSDLQIELHGLWSYNY